MTRNNAHYDNIAECIIMVQHIDIIVGLFILYFSLKGSVDGYIIRYGEKILSIHRSHYNLVKLWRISHGSSGRKNIQTNIND